MLKISWCNAFCVKESGFSAQEQLDLRCQSSMVITKCATASRSSFKWQQDLPEQRHPADTNVVLIARNLDWVVLSFWKRFSQPAQIWLFKCKYAPLVIRRNYEQQTSLIQGASDWRYGVQEAQSLDGHAWPGVSVRMCTFWKLEISKLKVIIFWIFFF